MDYPWLRGVGRRDEETEIKEDDNFLVAPQEIAVKETGILKDLFRF